MVNFWGVRIFVFAAPNLESGVRRRVFALKKVSGDENREIGERGNTFAGLKRMSGGPSRPFRAKNGRTIYFQTKFLPIRTKVFSFKMAYFAPKKKIGT